MAKRKSLHIEGMEHGAAIPNSAAIGNLGLFFGDRRQGHRDRRALPDPAERAEAMFRKLRPFMDTAGGTPDNHPLHESLAERGKVSRDGEQGVAQNVSRRARPARAPRAQAGAAQ